ncbi:MAG: hypothetical protein WBP86_03810, partial [Thiobacillaceae bacterium]
MAFIKHLSIMRLGAVALMAAALTACGGGGGGGGGGGNNNGGGGTSAFDTTAQVNGGNITGVTVNSPP